MTLSSHRGGLSEGEVRYRGRVVGAHRQATQTSQSIPVGSAAWCFDYCTSAGCARTSGDSARPPARSGSCFSNSMPRDLVVRKLGRLLLTRGPGRFFEGSANLLPSKKRESATSPLRIDCPFTRGSNHVRAAGLLCRIRQSCLHLEPTHRRRDARVHDPGKV